MAGSPAATADVKPLLRGWIHTVMAPLALVAGIALTLIAPAGQARPAVAVFAASGVALFTISATYHRGRWSPRMKELLRRLDHSAIALVIAGSYTPFAVLLLSARTATVLLSVVWTGAVVGVLFRVLWTGAPRWLYTGVYIALGWAAVWVAPQFAAAARPDVVACVVIGGLLYTIGALAYAFKRPDPVPTVFGYHEIFHAFTVLAFSIHAIGVALAVRAIG